MSRHRQYSDVIVSKMASQITGVAIVYSTVCSCVDQRKHQSSAWLAFCAGNSLVTGEIPTQRASHADNAFISWRHHATNKSVRTQICSCLVGITGLQSDLNWPLFQRDALTARNKMTSNGSWCIGIKGEMSGTVCVTFTWDIYIYIWVVYSFCLFCCLFIIVTWWYIWCIVSQVASKRKYRHVW